MPAFSSLNRAVQTLARVNFNRLIFIGTALFAAVSALADPPTITAPPANQTACANGTATFNVTAVGTDPLSYQWYFDEATALTDATNATLTIVNAQAGNAGNYTVVVTNIEGAVTSVVATLTVNTLPVVTVNSETICSGGSATLTATTAAASPSYLWSPGGATTASIMVSPASTTTYTVTVTDGTTTCANSSSGTVTVNPLPTVTVNSRTTCPGDSTTLTATTSATNPSYLWSPGGETTASIIVSPAATTSYSVTVSDGVTGCSGNGSGTVTVRTPQVFANTGAIAIGDFTAASPYPSVVNVSGLTATVCRVAVTLNNLSHAFPDDIDIVLIAPNGQGALLMSDVGGANPVSGIALTFDDSAGGSLSDSGQLVSGTYKPTNIGAKSDNRPDNFPAPVPAANFVTNLSALAGINPNGAWSLYINDDELVDVGSIGGGWSIALTTLTPIADLSVAQTPIPNPVSVGSNLTFNITASNLGPADANAVSLTDTLPTGMTFVSANTSQGSCGQTAGVITCALGSISANSSATVTIVVVPASAGAGNNVVSVASDTLDLVAANNSSSASFTVLDPPAIVTGPVNQVVCADHSVAFSVTATGAAPLSYQWYLNNVAIGGATASSYSIASAQAGNAGTYKVIVSNPVGAAQASATLTVNPLPTATVTGATICVGQSATLTAVTSAANPSYLWSPGGQITASVTVSPASTTVYTVLVTDGVTGCTNSASATVTVKALTVATALTSVTNLCPGSPVSFSTIASGDGPFTFVWRKNGTALAETSGTLAIASVTAADAGTYTVEVTGFCNTVTNSATLTVVAPPTITAQPQNQATPMGNGAVFSVAASSVAASNIQWQVNGVDIGGATSTSLAVSNLTLTQNGGAYRAIVSNCGGATTSAVAVLTVTPVSGISFDFDTPGQYTNAPYYLTYNNWINGGFLPGIPAPTVYESPIGGVGPFPGGGGLEMSPNQGTESTSILLPVNFDFSLTGKTIYASTMFKVKTPITAGRRATQFGFVTSTNLGINDQTPQGFATVIVQAPTAGTPSYELRTQRRLSGGGLQESLVVAATPLTVSNWYRLNMTFLNTKSASSPSTYTIMGSLQDMGPLGTTPGATNASFTTTTNNADIVNFKNVYLALRSFEDGGMEARDNTYVWTTPGNILFVQEPQSQTVLQGNRAVFKALVDGEGPYTYVWQRGDGSGGFTNIPLAGSWNYITPPARTSDNGAQIRVVVTGPANTVTSSPVTLTVTPQALAVVSAGSVDGTTVGVQFNQPVQPASAENVANYTINGVNPVQARVYRSSLGALGPEGIYVVLTPASVLSGSFTVAASGVLDLSGGVVGGANTATGSVAGLTGFDVNPLVTGPPGENYSFGPGQFIITGGGPDIAGVADGFRFVYTTRTGDFDIKTRVSYMDTIRFVSKAGFDARISLDPFSPMVVASFNPGPMAEGSGTLRQFSEGNVRNAWNVGTVGWGNNARMFHPDVWLRLRRAGNTFLRYSSTNGVNWLFDGQTSPTTVFPPTIYVGLAVSAVRNLSAESAQFENYGEFGGYPGAAIAITAQPTNFTVSAGSSFTDGLIATLSGGGAPASAGELSYLWQRNDGSGNFTNLVAGGATNNTIAIGPLFGSDNGAQLRAIVRAPGAPDVISATFTATITDTAAPTLTSANGAILPSYQASEVTLIFSENVSAATATDIANYTVTNAAGVRLTVLSATFLSGDPRNILLKVDGLLGSGTSTVGITGVRDQNNNSIANTVRSFRSFLPSTAPVVVEVYQDIGGGTAITDLTGNAIYTAGTPTFICYSNLFGYNVQNNFTSIQDNYGVKVYSYFVPPTNGNYKFWIRSDDAMELRLNSSGTSPAGAVLIAANAGANNNYTVGSTPASSITNIALSAGQSYYMEALLKEGGGGDGFSVMWTDPTVNTAPGTGTLIPTANLAYPASAAPSTPVVMDIYTGYQNFLAGFNQMAGLTQATNFPTGNYAIDTVNFKYIAGVPDVIGYQKYFGVQPVTLGNTRLDNYLGRIQSYFIPPSTGLYRFWIGVDDVAQLYMNTNAVNSTDPAGVVFLGQSANAFVSTASQLVAQNVPLVGGQKYYMMALWREGGGGDGIRIAVRPQSDASAPPTTEVIPASMLEYPLAVGRAGAVNFAGIAPLNPTVPDGQSVMLCAVGIVGAPISAAGSVNGTPYGFIWLKNGVRVQENAFTNITAPLTMADNGSVYTLVVTNLFSRMERSVTITVVPDGTAPTILRTVGRRYNDGFTIVFSEPLDAASATYLGNYQVSGGLALRSATLDPGRNMVSFETSPQAPNTTYTITVNGVRDASSTANVIAPNTITSFSTWSVGGSGFLVELYTNIAGTAVSDLTGTPKFAANLPDVVYYTNAFGMGAFGANTGIENYGGRITGYFVPTNTGYYRFYVRSDDASQLWMNINSADSENPAGRTMLIHMPNANVSMQDPRAISPPVFLNQGQHYYIEGLMKEGGGGDYFLATFRSTDANGTAVGVVPPVDTVAELQPATSFDGAPGDPGAIQITQTPPSDVFVTENEAVSLKLVASIPPNILRAVSYQWQKFDGAAYTNIPGATASTLNFFANLSDNLAKYRLVFSAPGRNASYLTTLHVSSDGQPPFIVSASSLDGRTIGLCFNERLYTPNAIDNFNYTVNGGANAVNVAEQRSDLRSVILYVDPPVSGAFTVRAESQIDLATLPNEGNSTTNGIVQGFTPMDVGAPVAAGSSFSCVPGEIDVIAGGNDIWANSDVGHLTLSQRSGDFDIHARVQSLTPADPAQPSISKAGLMIRQTLDANSTTIYHSVNPPPPRGRDLGEVGQRSVIGGATALFAGSASYTPAGIPNAWIRAQRRGNTFTFFRSSDGLNWIQVASGSTAFSNQVFIGLATTAHTATQAPGLTTFAEYRDIYIPNPPTILVQPSPASQTVPLGASVTYSVVASNPPNSGPLIYQWRRNGVAISGATSATLTLNNLSTADSGSYAVQAGNDGGATVSDAVTLVVSNALPIVMGESLSTTQNVALTINAASLLANDSDPEGATLVFSGVNGLCAIPFTANFENGLPPNTAVYGTAYVDGAGGAGNSGCLKLTDSVANQLGAFIIEDLSPGVPVAGFTASFKIRVAQGSGNPADGFSLSFANDLPSGTIGGGEEGGGTGLIVAFDNYNNGAVETPAADAAPAVGVKWAGAYVTNVLIAKIQDPNYLDVYINLDPDGTIDVSLGGTLLINNLPTPYTPITGGRFGLAARTGGEIETHWVDDLRISVLNRTPRGALVSLNSNTGVITYTPAAGSCGPDSFAYFVNDGQQGGTVCGIVNVHVAESIPTPPTITTCPTNRTVTVTTGTQIPLPDLTVEVVASDNCCCVAVTQSPAPGTLVGPGQVIVTFTATDTDGQTATCQATVTVVVPTTLTGANYSGGTFSASVQTVTGLNYTVQYKNNLNDPGWTTLTVIAGDGTLKSFTDPGPLPPTRFYRVSVGQ